MSVPARAQDPPRSTTSTGRPLTEPTIVAARWRFSRRSKSKNFDALNDSQVKNRNFEIGESCNSNPKSEISSWTSEVQSKISDIGFEMKDSSNFQIPPVRKTTDL